MSTPVLNRDFFNPTLYKQLQDVWFEGHELDATEVDERVLRRWWSGSPDEKLAFDRVCRDTFAHALESIGPDKFPNPSGEPFVRELREVAQKHPEGDGSEAAWTALSMVILLDQVPRNIYRTNDGLFKVYNHYDKICYSLIQTLLSPESPIIRPDLHPQWRRSVAHRMWFYLPLMHSEDVKAHEQHKEIREQFQKEMNQEEGSEQMKKFLDMSEKAEREHKDIVDKFGRYPHRNAALGRTSTPEEEKFLAEGGATFGVAQQKEK